MQPRIAHSPIKSALVLTAATAGLALVSSLALTMPSYAEKTVMVGGAEMFPSKNIIQNAMNSKDHTTLVAAVKAAGLVDTLSGKGPFTVFAPTNDAFEKLPKGTVDTLLKPENKSKLAGILTYHVVSGTLTAEELASMVDKMGGEAKIKTVNGEQLTVKRVGEKHLAVYDPEGRGARITIADVMQSNGVIHVIDTVEQPN